ncbi:serine/threonine-protein kinase B [bacterium BMS3Bbin10]|nr:serine/threonine-protein kinase B [bacterium BMS3Bbin10]
MMSTLGTFDQEKGSRLDLRGAFVRRTDLSNANLHKANLSRADLSGAILRGANLKDTNLFGAILKGADLRDAKNLTVDQLSEAIIDSQTLLPDYIPRSKIKKNRLRLSEGKPRSKKISRRIPRSRK